MFSLANGLLVLAILNVGVVYGVDVFFAVVGRSALAQSSDTAITDVMGHLHKVADARMPIFGGLGILTTLAFAVTAHVGTPSSGLAFLALIGLLVQLALYLTVAKPVNTQMTKAAQQGQTLANTRELQNRWDSVVTGRALAMTLAVACLAVASVLH